MEDTIVELVKQVPALGVLAFVVMRFLRIVEHRDKLFVGQLSDRDKILSSISEECHTVQRDAIECIRKSAEVQGEVLALLRRLNGKESAVQAKGK